jgi:hypothetical protein
MNEWIAISIVAGISLGGFIWQSRQTASLRKKYQNIFKSNDVEDIDGLVEAFSQKFRHIEKNQKRIFTELDEHASMLSQSVQHVSLYRFNPFKDMGGDNSFVLVLLDPDLDGILLTSLTMRDTSRVYAKELKAGKSLVPLHQEEKRILQEALIALESKSKKG